MLYDKLEVLEGINDRGPIFLRDDGTEVTYSFARLVSEARRVQSALQAHGFVKGDRIAVVIPDNQQFITTFLGAVMAGIIPVPMCPPFVVGQINGYLRTIRTILDASGARAVIASMAMAPFLELSRKQVKSIEAILLYDELENASTVNPKHVDLIPDDTCFLQFTSGSTAMPKGVIVTHRNLMANARAMLVDALALDPQRDVGVNWLPLYHDMGLVGNVLAALLVEVPVVYIPTLSFIKNPQIWMAVVSRYRGTVTFGPNFAYGLAAKRATDAYVSTLDLSCLRVVGCGAEPINGEVLRSFQELFAPAGLNPNAIMPCYGMAEATLAICFSSTLKPFRRERIERDAYEEGIVRRVSDANLARSLEVVSCGTTFPDHEVAVFSHSGEQLGEGRVGEIGYRGPSVTAGYYNNPEATGRAIKDGWLHTGDVGFMLNGEVFVSGRLKDLIIINGRNYYPQDIEWTVEKVNGIRRGNVVAFGVHENGMETIVVVAEIKGSTPVHRVQQDVKQITMSTLGLTITKVMLIPTGRLPKTTSGKIQRQKTKAAYEQGILGQERWRYTHKVTFWCKYGITQILTRLPTRWRLTRIISRRWRWLSGQRNSYQSTVRDIGASQR